MQGRRPSIHQPAMEGIDEISKLPEPILVRILSFLVVKDAAKTSILSRVWYNAWMALSCLNFGDEIFVQSKDIVDQILANRQKRKISIQRFLINLPDHSSISNYVDNWIKILVGCNVKELFVKIPTPVNGYIKLPEEIFAAKGLNVLSLSGFQLDLPSDGIKFSSLRELHLVDSFLDEQLIQAICASCTALEVLSFKRFHGLISLQVAGTLPKLRKVKLKDEPLQYFRHNDEPLQFQMVDIVAPNLTDLKISCGGDSVVIEVSACKSLKHLKLFTPSVTEQWLDTLFSKVPNLETLDMYVPASVRTLKISSDTLKCLYMLTCPILTISPDTFKFLYTVTPQLTDVDLDTPNLFKFSSDIHYIKKRFSLDVDTFPMFKVEAPHLLEVDLRLLPDTIDNSWYSKLPNSLACFNQSKVKLFCFSEEGIVIPKDMRKHLIPPLHRTKHLHVVFLKYHKFTVVDLLDSLLWISPQLDSLSVQLICNSRTLSLKFTYRRGTVDEKPCCASLPWKCWRHELIKVELQKYYPNMEELQNVRNYFFTNAGISEIIEVPAMQP